MSRFPLSVRVAVAAASEETDLFRGNFLRPAGSGGLFRPAVLVAHTRSGVLSGANLFTISPTGDLLR